MSDSTLPLAPVTPVTNSENRRNKLLGGLAAVVGLAAVGAAAMALFHRGNSVSQEDEAEARELVREELRGAPAARPGDKGKA